MIHLIPIKPPRPSADDIVRILIVEPHQLPPGVPLEQSLPADERPP